MKSPTNPYRQAQRFADLTKRLLLTGQQARALRCLRIAEALFRKGDARIRNAIANVYVYSVTPVMEMQHRHVGQLLPANLRREYYHQITASGI